MLFVPGSAVRLPYHQPEKKDLSVFLARTELKQQKFVGASRLSWKQFIPPASTITSLHDVLLPADATTASSEKVSSTLPAAKSGVPGDAVERGGSELDELPDLLSFCSKSKADVSEAAVTQAEPASRSWPQKLLLLSPVKNTPATTSERLPLNSVAGDVEQVETSLTPDVRKKLILDPVDETSCDPLRSAETQPPVTSKLLGIFIPPDLS